MRVAAAQAASVWLDPAATTKKVISLLEQASGQDVELVAFPEAFSGIVAADGSWVVEPVLNEERLITAEIDPAQVHAARYTFDPAGHYSRPNVFTVTVDRRRQEAASFTGAAEDALKPKEVQPKTYA